MIKHIEYPMIPSRDSASRFATSMNEHRMNEHLEVIVQESGVESEVEGQKEGCERGWRAECGECRD